MKLLLLFCLIAALVLGSEVHATQEVTETNDVAEKNSMEVEAPAEGAETDKKINKRSYGWYPGYYGGYLYGWPWYGYGGYGYGGYGWPFFYGGYGGYGRGYGHRGWSGYGGWYKGW